MNPHLMDTVGDAAIGKMEKPSIRMQNPELALPLLKTDKAACDYSNGHLGSMRARGVIGSTSTCPVGRRGFESRRVHSDPG
jgi:hypothetical protein